ncbi:TolB family protein [Vibrio sp. 10N.261.55.F4]|uniref:TolB family protein n=1 Tax=Vibrio sp. 10N.261.55.F4 TaxID=3229692 RepID=UPI003552512A
MKQTTLSIMLLSSVMLLTGCGEESNQTSNTATAQSVEKEPAQKACYDVGETTSFERKDVTEPRCQWQSEHNFIVYSEDLSKPEYPGTLPVKPGYAVRRAKEWPREDLSDASSYDKPRIQFWWNNVSSRDPLVNDYENGYKIWSVKIDGTDLRLVTDDMPSMASPQTFVTSRSPNNRYVAYAYSYGEPLIKAIFDLKTQQTIQLGSARTKPYLVWADDSSYIYFSDGFKRFKYTLATGIKEEVDVPLSENTVIVDGKLINAAGLGVGVYDAKTLKRLYTILPEKEFEDSVDIEKRIYRQIAVSPNGKYVWGINSYRKVLINVEDKTWLAFSNEGDEKKVYAKVVNISNNGNETQIGAAKITIRRYGADYRYEMNGNGAQSWGVVQSGRIAKTPVLYNADANGGRFLEVDNDE